MMTKSKARVEAESWLLDLMTRMEAGEYGSDAKITITPEMADVLLEQNPNNRRVRATKLQAAISDISKGRWKWNGESIILASTGELNDGQHRLMAASELKHPIETTFVWGVPRDSRDTVDTGSARSPGDMFAMTGLVNGTSLAAITRMVLGYETNGNLGQLSRISTKEIVDRGASDRQLQLIASWVNSSPIVFQRMIPKSVAGAAFYILHRAAPKFARTFMERLRDGDRLTKDSPIWTLRQKLQLFEKRSPQMKLEMIFRTWNAWIEDRPLSKLPVMGRLPTIISADDLDKKQQDQKIKKEGIIQDV